MAEQWTRPGCVLHGLEISHAEIAGLRKRIQAAGCYGKVSVVRFDGKHLPYVNSWSTRS